MTKNEVVCKWFSIAQSFESNMASKSAARLLAIGQARSKFEELTRKDVVSFSFILTDEGPELFGEEDLVAEAMQVFEERDLVQLAQRIKLRGQALNHRSTRTIKVQQMQEAFNTRLPPTLLPLGSMMDYDLIRSLFNEVMKVEGLGTLWQAGEDPPQSVREWWGEEDWDLFRMYRNQNLNKDMMDLIRGRHRQFQKHALFYFKEKIVACYQLRVGQDQVSNYHMRLPKAAIEEVKQTRMRNEQQEQVQQRQAEADVEQQQMEARIEAAVEARVQQEVDERVERAVQERVRERTRQAAAATSPVRRRRRPEEAGEVHDDVGPTGGEEGDGRAENNRRMVALSQLVADPDSSVLQDPAAVAVLRQPTVRAGCSGSSGPSRPTRQLYKCPYDGCFVTRNSQDGINMHIENSHDD